MVTIPGPQLMVSDRGYREERVEMSRNRKGSEITPRAGTMIADGEISHRRAEVARTAQVAETAETAETVSRFVGGR